MNNINKLERWLAFFNKEIPEDELKGLMEMDADIRNAELRMNHFTQDKATMDLYDSREKALLDRNSEMNHAKRKGIEEGFKRGIEQGIEQGIERGIEQGKYNEKITLATNLIHANMEVNFIVNMTGLTRDEVIALINNLDSR